MTANVYDSQCINFMQPQSYAFLRYFLSSCLSNRHTCNVSKDVTNTYFWGLGPNSRLISYNSLTKPPKRQVFLILNVITPCFLAILCLLGILSTFCLIYVENFRALIAVIIFHNYRPRSFLHHQFDQVPVSPNVYDPQGYNSMLPELSILARYLLIHYKCFYL